MRANPDHQTGVPDAGAIAPAPVPPQRLRVAWVFDLDACRNPTGVTRHALAQRDELSRRAEAVDLVTVTGRFRSTEGQADWERLDPARRVRLPWRLRDMLRAWRVVPWPGLEWWTGRLDWVYCPAEMAVAVRHARRAVTSHDVMQNLRYGGSRSRRRLEQAFRAADVILSVSRFNTQQLLEAFPWCEGRVAEIPNAADDLYFEPPTEAEREAVWADLDLPRGQPYLISVAGFQERKNLPRLIAAAARLAEVAAGDMALVLVGDGDPAERATIDRAIGAANPRARIVRPGYRQGPALRALYAQATALVFPSLCESFGIPVVEAMAQSCPVAIADTTALPEIAGEAGWGFDPMKEEAIADAVRQLLDQPAERARRVDLGRERAALYRWSRSADRLLQVLESGSAASPTP